MKKLLPILIVFALVCTQVSVVFADQAKVDEANKAATQASKNYEIAKAYAEYLSNPDSKDTIIKLGKLVLPQGTDLSKLPTNDQMRALLQNNVDSQQALLNAKVITSPNEVYGASTPAGENYAKKAKSAVDETKKISDQKSLEATYQQRNLNSEKIALQYTNTETDDIIRAMQDAQSFESLGCRKDPVPNQALCDEITQQSGVSKANYDTFLPKIQKALQGIEAEEQDKLKKALQTEHINVSNILSFKVKDANGKVTAQQTQYIPTSPNKSGGIIYFLSRMIDVLVIVVSSVAVVTLIIGGYMFMFSGGDEQQRENGKDVLIYTVFGLIFVYASYAIVSLIQGLIYF